PPYSLPRVEEMNGHDGWTTVKDRAMKKRIQNRVTQRTYRQRVKVRMADLQAKLDNCEKKLQSRENDYQDVPIDPRHSNTDQSILSTLPHTATPISCDDALRLIDNSAGMDVDERVGSIIMYLETMGFETFDDLVRTYYGQQFGEASFLCNEQRLSRNRRFPGVIASLFCAAAKWTTWERRGFQEEILKATEAMLISESVEAHIDLQAKAVRALEAPRSSLSSVKLIVSPLKNNITSKVRLAGNSNERPCSPRKSKRLTGKQLPNLWALMVALAASTNPGWNKDHSGAALAAIILLQCAGRMEKDTVLELV
ncbi:hypothetical protein BU25DRAFT_305328, partial [Macroventuria anomochaeta]